MSGVGINTRIKHKRDSETNWSTNNPVMLQGECIIVDMNDGSVRIKIGDGINHFESLPYADDDLRNIISAINAVPASTTDDDGKILSVSNGVATWVSITNAEVVRY